MSVEIMKNLSKYLYISDNFLSQEKYDSSKWIVRTRNFSILKSNAVS